MGDTGRLHIKAQFLRVFLGRIILVDILDFLSSLVVLRGMILCLFVP
jgi:hypothetical protein